MNDMLGVPVNISDEVLYSGAGQGDTYLLKGTVVEIKNDYAIILSNSSKRRVNRKSRELVNIQPIKAQCPEYFI